MDIDYNVMRGVVLLYCNQDYPAGEEPDGLKAIIEAMCKYAAERQPGLIGFSNQNYSESYSEKDMFQNFSGLLSPYKRLRTL